MKKNLFLLFIILCMNQLTAQNQLSLELQQIFHKAYTTNNAALWEIGIQQLQQNYQQSKEPSLLLAIARAESGLVGTYMGSKDLDKAEKVANTAEEHLLEILENMEDNADANALYGGILGMQIGFSPMKAMWLGPKSNKYISKALELEEDNVIALYQKASSSLYTPAMFGGDVPKAISTFKQAINIYEQSGESLDYNWGYLSTLTGLGIACMENNLTEDAITHFNKCLKIAPDFAWVKYQLLPSAEKRATEEN